jgi:ABC-type methionine transport system permease subunit
VDEHKPDQPPRRTTRREFLRLTVGSGSLLVLAACGGTPAAPAPTEAPAAPAPTEAPAAPAPTEAPPAATGPTVLTWSMLGDPVSVEPYGIILFAIPSLVLAIVIAGLLGPNLTNAMIAIGIVYAPIYARLVRGEVLAVRNHLYIESARATGVGDLGLVGRHILPNIMAPLIVQTTLLLSTAILAEAALSFLGLGTQPPDPSWGTMLGSGRRYMELTPWVAIAPGIAIVITVLGFNLLGDGLRDALDPRLRGSE